MGKDTKDLICAIESIPIQREMPLLTLGGAKSDHSWSNLWEESCGREGIQEAPEELSQTPRQRPVQVSYNAARTSAAVCL